MTHFPPRRPHAAVTLALLLLACHALPAAENEHILMLRASSRLRYEFIDGQVRPGFNNSDDLINLRTTLFGEYRHSGLRVGVELFDSRMWGEDGGTPVTSNEVNALEPVQAYVANEFADVFGAGSKLGVTAGRMMLNLGSRRLVAADDYRNTTNGYTGLRLDYSAARDWKATLIYTLPQLRLPADSEGVRDAKVKLDRESTDLVLWGGVASRANTIGNATAELTFLHLEERDSANLPTRDRSLDTFGGRVFADPRTGEVDYEFEALYQTGHISTSATAGAPTQPVRANLIHAGVGYSFATAWRPRLSLVFDRFSGDKPGGRYNRFDTLFGTRRSELAPSGIYATVGRANAMTPGLRLEAVPSEPLDWFIAYRALWLAEDTDSFSTSGVRDASGASGSFAGHQIEGRARYWLLPDRLRLEFNGLLLARGRFLRDAPDARPGRWTRYASLNLTVNLP